MKKVSPIVQKAEEYVFHLLREKLPGTYIYHNYHHTSDVVDAVAEIAEGCDLSKEETELVLLAGWFHDSGFTEAYNGHEEASKKIAEKFLKENLYPEEKIEKIIGCIEATKYPQNPKNIYENIVCDADLAGISKKSYLEKSKFLRMEQETVRNIRLSDIDWLKSEINFFTQHKYHTPYAHVNFDKRKNEHIIELKERLTEAEGELKKESEKKKSKEVLKEEKEKRPEKGVETVFRVTYSNHMALSKMADDKANFLLSINGILVSFAISGIVSKLDVATNNFLILPTAILMGACLTSIIFAILSTRPKITGGKFTKEDVHQKRANLLFFGNFYNMQLDDFEWGFAEMMKDREFLYGSMVKDIYFLGKVLGKKYRLVRTAYTFFMYGLILSVVSYAVAYWYYFDYLGRAATIQP